MTDRVVVAMDGSTRACTVALLAPPADARRAGKGWDHDRWEVRGRRSDVGSEGGARGLLHFVDELLRELGAVPQDITGVVVGTGPGTFTGVRLAVATARALALAVDCPVLGVSTLSALAAQAACETWSREGAVGGRLDRLVCFVDAKRGQVFYAVYEAVRPQQVATGSEQADDTKHPGRSATTRTWQLAGGYGVCAREELAEVATVGAPRGVLVGEDDGSPVLLPPGWTRLPCPVSAEHLVIGQGLLAEPGDGLTGHRALAWLTEVVLGSGGAWSHGPGCPGSPESVQPIYVRPPDADVHITKMRDPWA